MLRRFGREDDLLVLNFMNDASSVVPGRINTNSINPFATGSADELTQMMVSMMDEVGGDGAMWKGRAIAMLTGVMRALVEKRDKGLLDLNVGEIRRHMVLTEIEALARDQNLSPSTIAAIQAYLRSLPGYKENPGEKGQAQTTLDQHGYLQMQFTKILGSLTDVYGHIFSTPYGEVDIADVVLNRRILVIMLPALKKSGDEINNLGKIVVANLKGMMGNVLGSTIDGRYEDIVDKRATNAPSPFIVVLDEVGYYTVDGMAVMAAQARSLGFSLVFASQDIPAMKRRNEKEADSIIANTNVKIIMRLEDPGATAKLAIERGDKALRVRVGGFDRQMGDVSGLNYVQNASANFEETSRISLRDLAAQKDGEMHVLFQDRIIRARSFFANPEGAIEKSALRPRPNHFLRVPRPSSERYRRNAELETLLKRLTAKANGDDRPGSLLTRVLRDEEARLRSGATADTMNRLEIASVLSEQMSASGERGARASSPMSAACVALARIAARAGDPSEEKPATTPQSSIPSSERAKEASLTASPGVRQDAGLPGADRGPDTTKPQRHKVVLRQDGKEREFSGGISETVREMAAKSLSASTIPGFPTEAQIHEFQRLVEEGSRTDGVAASDTSGLDDLGLLDELDRLGRTPEGASKDETGDDGSRSAVLATDGEQAQAASEEEAEDASGGGGTRATSGAADLLSILYGEDEDEEEE
jgi:intracellular multiplication protein IcmO